MGNKQRIRFGWQFWVSFVLLPVLVACQLGSPNLVGGQFWGQQRQQAVTSTAQQPDKIELRFDPGLLGGQYQGLPKVPFAGGFRVQQQSHLFDQLDQLVLDKAEQLNIAGQGHCVYLPDAQPQNGNCNSTSIGLQCSGALDKTIQTTQCAEMVVYGGAVNINHDLSGTKLFVASSNNLTLNQSVEGILTTRGDLNISISNQAQLSGVFVGARANNFNMSGNARIDGLFSILNQGSLAMNLNPSSVFEGQLCTTGQSHLNINSQLIYNTDKVTPWQSDLPMLAALMCEAGTTPYTQIIEPGTPTPTPTPEPTATPTPEPTPTPDLSVPPDEVIFDPADPTSLGDLYPAIPGNEDVEVPQTSEVYLAINEHLIAPAAIGEVMIHVAEPVAANLQAIKERYLGDVIAIDADDAYYLLKVNMRAIELNQLEEKLLQLNTEITDPADMIRSVSIGNLESARTFALLVDLLTNEHIRGAELNTYWEPQSFSSYEGGGDLGAPGLGVPVASPRPFFVPNNVQNYWWLNEHSTRLNEAWHYNMGYNYTTDEPVQVAVIDVGFAGLSTLTSNGQDLAGRVRINQGFIDRQSFDYQELVGLYVPVPINPVTFYTSALMMQENTLACKNADVFVSDPSLCKLNDVFDYSLLKSKQEHLINYPHAHGTLVTATLAAQISNGSGTAGASPYVDIIPIKVGSGLNAKSSELIHALRTIHDHPNLNKVSVINISMGPQPDINVTRAILAGRYTDGAYSRLNKAVYDLWNKKVITVFAAGNDSIDAKYNMNVLNPHSLVAGAVQLPPAGIHGAITPSLPHLPNPQALSRSVWNSTDGSNWSPSAHAAFNVESIVTVYAPGSNMLSWQIPTRDLTGTGVIVPDLTSSSGHRQAQAPFESTWKGTSASAPIVAGTVALMKGIKPDLSFAEARLALIDTAHQHTYMDNNLIEADGKPLARQITLRILNAEAAVKRIYEQNFVGSGRMQSFAGTLLSGGGKYRLQLSANPSQIYDLQWGPFATENAVDNTYQLRLPLPLGNNPPIRNFLNQPMQVQGHLRGSRLYVHQIQPDFGAAVPAAPTGVQFENIQTHSFRVIWNPSSQASSYEVHVNGSLYQSTSNTTLTVASRTPDTSYTVTIRALNSSGGASPFSTPAHVRTLALAPTPPPVCTSPVVDTVVTNTSWQWAGGGTYIVSNPWYTPQISGAFPIWVSEGACTQCSYVIYRSYNLPQNWYVKQAYVDIQANQFANVMVRGRAVGQASSQSFSPPQRFNIDPDHFGPGGNNLTLSFLAQNFTSPRPSVTARFTIERCPQ